MRLRCISAGRFADATNNGNLVFVEVGEVWERVPYISISGSPYARLNREGRSTSCARAFWVSSSRRWPNDRCKAR